RDTAFVVAADERGQKSVVWDFEQRPANPELDDCAGDFGGTGVCHAAGSTCSAGRTDEGAALRVGDSDYESISTGFALRHPPVCENTWAYRGRRHYHRARSGCEHSLVFGG